MTNISNKELLTLATVEKDSIWAGSNKTFKVTDITEDDIGIWVHYVNVISNQTYNCLIDAFKSRFTREIK